MEVIVGLLHCRASLATLGFSVNSKGATLVLGIILNVADEHSGKHSLQRRAVSEKKGVAGWVHTSHKEYTLRKGQALTFNKVPIHSYDTVESFCLFCLCVVLWPFHTVHFLWKRSNCFKHISQKSYIENWTHYWHILGVHRSNLAQMSHPI